MFSVTVVYESVKESLWPTLLIMWNFILLFVLQELRLAKWLEQVNITLANTEQVSFDTLQELLETGNSLPQKTGMLLLSLSVAGRFANVQFANVLRRFR